MFCKRCRYNLTHTESRMCPECGHEFDPTNRKTFRKRAGWPKCNRYVRQGFFITFAVTLFTLGLIEWQYQQKRSVTSGIERVRGEVDWSSDQHAWSEFLPFLHRRFQHPHVVKFYDTGLTRLPSETLSLTKLKRLGMSGNELSTLSPKIGNLVLLERLGLANNRFGTLPPEIGNLVRLEKLDVSNNRLTTLQPAIGKLTNLEWLGLGENRLTSLPPQIGNLINLHGLGLENNQLIRLPSEIGNLSFLAELYLNGNPITDADLKHLTSLKNLVNLDLRRTKATKRGVATLELALPKCEIRSDF